MLQIVMDILLELEHLYLQYIQGDTSSYYAIITFSNVIIIKGFGSLGSSTTGTAIVYYI